MIYRAALVALISLLITITSCTEKIDITLDESYTRLVVDGSITTDTLAHTVRLTKTSSYYYDQPSPTVSNAQVSISDGEQTFDLTEYAPGVYRTDSTVHGIDGHTYTLSIKLADPIGGYSEYSASSTLYPVVPLDSVSLYFHSNWSSDGIWEVKCYVLEPPTVDFYRFLIYRNHELLTDSLRKWFVTDDKFLNGNYTNGIGIGYIDQGSPGEGLHQGDTVTVEVNNIGKDYYNFLVEAQTELFGSNPLFSGPPANVKRNINNGGVGFFAAYSTTRSSAVTPAFK
jgi:hypothetical protein